MLKSIAEVSPDLAQFVEDLNLHLSRPQQRHVKQIADGLITINGDKNLSNLYRHFVGDPCPKSAADSFREAPWSADDICIPLRKHLVKTAFQLAEAQGAPKRISLSIDDSFTEKDRHSKRLESVAWHFDHARSRPKEPVHSKGTVYVLLRLSIGEVSVTVGVHLYLRKKTVRQINRSRKKGERIAFRNKLTIAKQMLKAIEPLLPPGYAVYVLFDSWYASANLIRWCRKRNWHVICRLKSNRNLDRVPLKQHRQRLRSQHYARVKISAADQERATTYLVRSLTGKLNRIPGQVRAYISKRFRRDKHPRYYASTDPSLSAQQALDLYHTRWSCEVANWYIAERLGWADCRLWKVESSAKFLMVLWLALAFLEVQCAESKSFTNLADVIRAHREEHSQRLLVEACQLAMQAGDLAPVLERYLIAA
jgi:hypothetical protein